MTGPRTAPTDRRAAGAPAPTPRVHLLNGFRVTRDDHPVVLPRAAERLVAYLALTGPCERAHVARTLWPEMRDDQAYACLRSGLWRLGRLCPGVVTATAATVIGAPADDVQRFRAVAETLIARRSLTGTDRHSFTDLMRTELLPGWYDDWVIAHRERLRRLALLALETASGQLLEQGAYAPALEAALAAIAAEPLRESGYRAAARIHLAEGNLIQAHHQYEACRRLMTTELGTGPSREFQDLVGPPPAPAHRRRTAPARRG